MVTGGLILLLAFAAAFWLTPGVAVDLLADMQENWSVYATLAVVPAVVAYVAARRGWSTLSMAWAVWLATSAIIAIAAAVRGELYAEISSLALVGFPFPAALGTYLLHRAMLTATWRPATLGLGVAALAIVLSPLGIVVAVVISAVLGGEGP